MERRRRRIAALWQASPDGLGVRICHRSAPLPVSERAAACRSGASAESLHASGSVRSMSATTDATWRDEPRSFDDARDDATAGMLDWGISRPPAELRDIFAALGKVNGSGKAPMDFMQNRRLSLIPDDNAYLRQMVVYCRQAGCDRFVQAWTVARVFTLPDQFGRMLGEEYGDATRKLIRLFNDTEPE